MTLTKELIDSTPVGRELDALVAERLFGHVWYAWADYGYFVSLAHPLEVAEEARGTRGVWQLLPSKPTVTGEGKTPEVPKVVLFPSSVAAYSTSIADAWQVVEHLKKQYSITIETEAVEGKTYATCKIDGDHWVNPALHWVGQTANSVPEAICRAALLTLL